MMATGIKKKNTEERKMVVATTNDQAYVITEQETLAEVLEAAKQLVTVYGPEATIEFYSGHQNIDEYIRFERKESDYEYQTRLALEATLALKAEEELRLERETYERLKKKFEGEGSTFNTKREI